MVLQVNVTPNSTGHLLSNFQTMMQYGIWLNGMQLKKIKCYLFDNYFLRLLKIAEKALW